jgi:hypothetical protein
MDADFTADLQFNEFHRITQKELNDLVRDLDLPKRKAVRFKTATMEPYERKCQNFCLS